jgi:AID/APOBEC-like deaminase family protein
MVRLSTTRDRERDAERQPAPRPGPPSWATHEVLQLQRTLGNRATAALLARRPAGTALQRQITWKPDAPQIYARSSASLLDELSAEFRHVDRKEIAGLIRSVEEQNAKWSPFQAYRGIANALRESHPPPGEALDLTGTNITRDEAEWYFISNFKTFAEVIIDGVHRFEFFNTPDDNHAEDNMMKALDRFIVSKRWHEDFSGTHTILMRINNSPCKRCARRIYDWDFRDIFVDFDIQFANMYEKGENFTKATTKLRSGGMVLSLMSVTNDLVPLLKEEKRIAKAAIEERARKDTLEAMDWSNWQVEHPV